MGAPFFDEILSLRTSSSRSQFHQSLDMQQILETTSAPLATHSDSSFSAGPRFAPLSRPRFLRVPQYTLDSRGFLSRTLIANFLTPPVPSMIASFLSILRAVHPFSACVFFS